ncbi:hypothetical protein DFH06DRAFT_1358775 [Mycena polygramma]|nr:hypothetical protein DFH06DRAFT_1358775 [Mycena polygramma]
MNILIWLCLLMVATYACNEEFPDARILRLHQPYCSAFKTAQALDDQRATQGESALERFKKKRRLEVDPPPVQPEPQASTSASNIEPQDVEMPFVGNDSPPPGPERPLTPPIQYNAAGRSIRAKRKTWKLLQQLPEPAPAPVDPEPDIEDPVIDPFRRLSIGSGTAFVPHSIRSGSTANTPHCRRTIPTKYSPWRNYPIFPVVLGPTRRQFPRN